MESLIGLNSELCSPQEGARRSEMKAVLTLDNGALSNAELTPVSASEIVHQKAVTDPAYITLSTENWYSSATCPLKTACSFTPLVCISTATDSQLFNEVQHVLQSQHNSLGVDE